jgi:carboxylesterase type B
VYLNSRFGDTAEQASQLYPVHPDADARDAEDMIATDMNFLYGTRSMVLAMARKNQNVYWYEFSRLDPLSRSMGISGAFHGAEMGYVNGDFSKALFFGPPFVTRPLDYGENERVILRAMNGAWVRFTKKGDPNGIRGCLIGLASLRAIRSIWNLGKTSKSAAAFEESRSSSSQMS